MTNMAGVSYSTHLAPRQAGTGNSRAWVPLLTGLVLASVVVPWLAIIAVHLWERPHYQVMPLVLVGVVALAWSSSRTLGELKPGHWAVTACLLVVSIPALALAIAAYSPFLGGIGLLVLLAAAAYGLGGRKLLRALVPAGLLLAMVVPLPFALDQRLVLALQRLTTAWSSALLDIAHVEHVVAGNVIQTSGQDLFVEEACSGIRSFFTIVACTLFYVLWKRRPVAHAVVIVAAAVGWVLIGNTARAALMTCAQAHWGINLTTGWKHEAIGIGFFLLTLGMVVSTDGLVRFLWYSPGRSARRTETSPSTTRLPDLSATWLGWKPATLSLMALAAWQAGFFGLESQAPSRSPSEFEEALRNLSAELLPSPWHGWERHDFRVETREMSNEFGANSRTWVWKFPLGQAVVSADFPFADWHELTLCYRSIGWTIEQSGLLHPEGLSVRVEGMTRPGSRHGYLLFAEFDEAGRPVHPRHPGFLDRLDRRMARFASRWFGLSRDAAETVDSPQSVCQVQLFIETYQPLSPVQQEQALMQFLEAYQKVRAVAVSAPQ